MNKTFIEWLQWLEDIRCHICVDQNEEEWLCERCNQVYCESCSAQYTYHSQIDYNCCESCANKLM